MFTSRLHVSCALPACRHTEYSTQSPPVAPADAEVTFPEGHEPSEFVNRVIECSWDGDKSAWRYMRHRLDKEYPNAYHVYEKVIIIIENLHSSSSLSSLLNCGGCRLARLKQQPGTGFPLATQRDEPASVCLMSFISAHVGIVQRAFVYSLIGVHAGEHAPQNSRLSLPSVTALDVDSCRCGGVSTTTSPRTSW